jgi:hypothetical protein
VALLVDYPDLVDQVGRFRWQEWAYGDPDLTRYIETTAPKVGRDRLSVTLVAITRCAKRSEDPITAAPHLRLVWPQWQGAGTESVRSLAPEFPFGIARRGYPCADERSACGPLSEGGPAEHTMRPGFTQQLFDPRAQPGPRSVDAVDVVLDSTCS